MCDDISTRQLLSNTFSRFQCDFPYSWSSPPNKTFPHFGGMCCVHVNCDRKSEETYDCYPTRGKKAEAYTHVYIYRYIYIERERGGGIKYRTKV